MRRSPGMWICRFAISVLVGIVPISAVSPAFVERPYDILIRGGIVVDGTGAPRFRADVAIRGDRIARVDRSGIPADQAAVVLEADGLIIAPGFIDHHAHIATNIHEYPLAENFLRQGITTILASLHSGDQPWPLDAYAASLKIAPNVGFFAGHTWIRKQVLGLENRAPTPSELERMKALVEESMKQGALGLSTGLLYVPAFYATTEEIIELAKVAARYGGIYVTHMRDEGPGLIRSVEETIRIAREAGIPAQINHHKVVGAAQFGWSRRTLELIDAARAEGLDIKHDLYPYTASSTGSSILFPQWALAGGARAFAERIADPQTRARIEREMRAIFRERAGQDLRSIQFRTVPSAPQYNGKTLADMVRDRGLPPTIESGIQVVIELQLAGGFSAIYHSMDEEDVKRIMQHPWAMFETDGDLVGYGEGFPHPRSYGAFPRVLARYVRELKVLTLEEAIRRMTSLSAAQIGQFERGVIREGMYADIVVFDPERIQDLATYTDPHRYSVGVVHLLVNGVLVIRNAALTGEKPGRVLRGPARPVRRDSKA
ncbi:MAG: D-aminoacylase [Blastocatellia bacterium]|nr:D-aminoacylase [Blastocatellia bacterium]MCS7157140.1 D-aminoacylase [Blastocatellia bacterium]MCX7752397.1 D-aminoacylase [Blastocatellia bacterium]MDW8167280.1 D-aminoacylase [Acidobacteriota bacterium]